VALVCASTWTEQALRDRPAVVAQAAALAALGTMVTAARSSTQRV